MSLPSVIFNWLAKLDSKVGLRCCCTGCEPTRRSLTAMTVVMQLSNVAVAVVKGERSGPFLRKVKHLEYLILCLQNKINLFHKYVVSFDSRQQAAVHETQN